MTIDTLVFFLLALTAVAAAVGMLMSKSAIYSALFLILNFVTVAIFYLILGAPFIALSQVTVYAGAIMVLFLFVIMLLGTEVLPAAQVLPWQRPVAIALAIVLFLEAGYWLIVRSPLSGAFTRPPAALNDTSAVKEMSAMLFNQYLLPFEVTSILLLVAMLGAILLTLREKPKKEGGA